MIETTVTVPEILYFCLTTVLLPVTGWLATNGIRLLKSYTVLDLKVRDACRDIDSLKAGHQGVDLRLTKVEDAIVAIRESAQQRDQQFVTLTSKLEQLPRLMALLEGLSATAQSIVPRPEVEARLRSAEERLRVLERRAA